jgi:hypothetical protein
MSENPELFMATRRIRESPSRIIGRNKEVKLSREILLQLRRAGLRLIPQLEAEV